MAQGNSTIDNLHHIDRGYELLVQKLKSIGANIERVENVEPNSQFEGNLSESKL
jgi:UDP-N-acetylglucosamine 1-carboxyvinyltransferase